MIRKSWWKLLGFVLLVYTCSYGFFCRNTLAARCPLKGNGPKSIFSCTHVDRDDGLLYSFRYIWN